MTQQTQLPNRPNDSSKSILITVDVEDWFQVENLRPAFPIETWDSLELRLEKSTHHLLDLFDQHGVQATFYVLGWIADRFSGLVNEISTRGHEVASHGFSHCLTQDQSEACLKQDIYHSKALLEDITGHQSFGYRAPSFSITSSLIEILDELGFCYDSSYNSFALNTRYGKANGFFQPESNGYLVAKNGIVELPISNLNICGRVIPWGGGGYFRLYPPLVFFSGVSRILEDKSYYNFYCHPWEFDPKQPRVNNISLLSRFRHYLNLDKTLNRLDRFLERFNDCNFVTCSKYLGLDNQPVS